MNNIEIKDYLKTKIPFDDSAKTIDFKKSHGSFLVDADGTEYLDLCTSFGSGSIGYNHPKLREKMMEHSEVFINKISNADLYSSIQANFIKKLFQILPSGFEKCFLVDNGTNAVDAALKTCFDFYAKKHNIKEEDINNLNIISFQNGFHGRCGIPISLTCTDINKTKLYPKHKFTKITPPGVHHPIDVRKVEQLEAISLNELENALFSGGIVAVIMEPLLSEGGNIILRKEYLQKVRDMTERYGTFLIFDEVQTFAMTEKFWLSEYYGVIPDIICFGKKLQISGFAVNSKINEVPNNVFVEKSRISSTFCGSTADMLRATFILEIIQEENLLANAQNQGEYIVNKITELSQKYKSITNIRGIGFLIGFDLPTADMRDALAKELNKQLFILTCGKQSIRLRPFLNMSRNECNTFLGVLEFALNNTI
jgi:L-lysine 6-transaminase